MTHKEDIDMQVLARHLAMARHCIDKIEKELERVAKKSIKKDKK